MTDPAAQAAYFNALRVRGIALTLQRVSGFAPNVTIVSSVALSGFVLNVTPNGSANAQTGLGAVATGDPSQNDRLVIVMAQDLSNSGFALPVVKGDQIVLPDSAEILNVTRVDPYKRAFAGAVEILTTGVS
jgi:hypothetical protein